MPLGPGSGGEETTGKNSGQQCYRDDQQGQLDIARLGDAGHGPRPFKFAMAGCGLLDSGRATRGPRRPGCNSLISRVTRRGGDGTAPMLGVEHGSIATGSERHGVHVYLAGQPPTRNTNRRYSMAISSKRVWRCGAACRRVAAPLDERPLPRTEKYNAPDGRVGWKEANK